MANVYPLADIAAFAVLSSVFALFTKILILTVDDPAAALLDVSSTNDLYIDNDASGQLALFTPQLCAGKKLYVGHDEYPIFFIYITLV